VDPARSHKPNSKLKTIQGSGVEARLKVKDPVHHTQQKNYLRHPTKGGFIGGSESLRLGFD
jgi:hypothetical protein